MPQTDLLLIIPTFNPSEGWERIFKQRYEEVCDAIMMKIPVVLVNDGSSIDISNGVDYLREHLGAVFHYLHYPDNRGKGGALKHAVAAFESKLYIFTDIDFPYTAASMKQILETMRTKTGIVTGFREEAYYADVSLFRTILSKSLRAVNQVILGLPVNDTQCGLKAFDPTVAELLLACKTNRFLIDLELLLAVSRKKIEITPTKVMLRSDIDFTKFNSTVLLKEVFNFISLIFRYRILP